QYTGGNTSGSYTLAAPLAAGPYEFRYCLQNSDTVAAKSSVTVTPLIITLTASPTTVTVGGPLTVSWTAPAGRPTTDWVGLFKADGSNTRVWWQYTGGTPSGSYTLAAPQDTGQYEFRYSLENGNTVAATSGIVTVTALTITLTASPTTVVAGAPLTVSWTAPAGRPTTDWVGL